MGAVFAGSRLDLVVLSETVGAASALKVAFATFQKTTRLLAAISHAHAAEHGVTDALIAEGCWTRADALRAEGLPST